MMSAEPDLPDEIKRLYDVIERVTPIEEEDTGGVGASYVAAGVILGLKIAMSHPEWAQAMSLKADGFVAEMGLEPHTHNAVVSAVPLTVQAES